MLESCPQTAKTSKHQGVNGDTRSVGPIYTIAQTTNHESQPKVGDNLSKVCASSEENTSKLGSSTPMEMEIPMEPTTVVILNACDVIQNNALSISPVFILVNVDSPNSPSHSSLDWNFPGHSKRREAT